MAEEKHSKASLFLSFIKREFGRHELLQACMPNNHIQTITDIDKLEEVDGHVFLRTAKGLYEIRAFWFSTPVKEPKKTTIDIARAELHETKEALSKTTSEKTAMQRQLDDKMNELRELEKKLTRASTPPGKAQRAGAGGEP